MSIQLLHLKLQRVFKHCFVLAETGSGTALLDESDWRWPTEQSFEILSTFTLTTFVFTLCYFLFIVDRWVLCKYLRTICIKLDWNPWHMYWKLLVVETSLMPGGSSMRCSVPPWNFESWNMFLCMTPRPASSSRDEKSPEGLLFAPYLYSCL